MRRCEPAFALQYDAALPRRRDEWVPTEVFFSSIVDVAVGIAGFAGIIAAVQHRGLSSWPGRQLILLQVLFFASAMAVVFALLP